MNLRCLSLAAAALSVCAIETPHASPRVIVEFSTPPLAQSADVKAFGHTPAGALDLNTPQAQAQIAQIKTEQQTFAQALPGALPSASVARYINEYGAQIEHTYYLTFNGMALDVGVANIESALRVLQRMPGVKAVYRDRAYQPTLYASAPLINVSSLWLSAAIGGSTNAGRSIKVASMDGGVHHLAPMFSGAGYSYPAGYPAGGLGDTNNNNGKIIASRAYFRPWDPPITGESNVWPGVLGTSHGVHTAGIAAGNAVPATYLGYTTNISGIAPAAWIMSYRVFYYSVTADQSFYLPEGVAALEDIVRDGADVVNNSWGGGPTGVGGVGSPLDQALINAANAGIFVSMSAGNSGPDKGTLDHAADEYITVAAASTAGGFNAGRLNITAPLPVPGALTDMAFAAASFGSALPVSMTSAYAAAEIVAPTNPLGVNPFPAGTFAGKYALIRRGTAEFGLKCLNAQNAGAQTVIIFNNAGNSLMNMGPGLSGGSVTVPCIFIGQSNGEAMVRWSTSSLPAIAQVEISNKAFLNGSVADRIAAFSSRGPGAGNVLKPDLAAPGVDTLSQGFTYGVTGELRHLGFGQASGTSMAAPHVAGAAALLRQIHPSWPNAHIKSALMSSSKYLGMYNEDGTPAQPLDMGAGRLDLARAADPGVILGPPSLGFGLVTQGQQRTLDVTLTSVAGAAETYTLGTLSTINGFGALTSFTGVTVTPPSVMITPGGTGVIHVAFNAQGLPIGDQQGFVVISGALHQAHIPVWARVTPGIGSKDVLLIDNDGSAAPGSTTRNYLAYYANVLGELHLTYDVCDIDAHYGAAAKVPEPALLAQYKAVLYFTGDNAYPGTLSWPTLLDMERLTEYANGGGKLIAMGQKIASGLGNSSFFHNYVLGGWQVQASVSGGSLPYTNVVALTGAPPAFAGIALDLRANADGASNLVSMGELSAYPWNRHDFLTNEYYPFNPLLVFPGTNSVSLGIVAIGHRNQPTLENPGVAYLGRAVYTSVGLEGVNSSAFTTPRAGLLSTFWNYLNDAPHVSAAAVEWGGLTYRFYATFVAGGTGSFAMSYRWDFGDATPFVGPQATYVIDHTYAASGVYTARVEVVDSWGNRCVATTEIVPEPAACLALGIALTAVARRTRRRG